MVEPRFEQGVALFDVIPLALLHDVNKNTKRKVNCKVKLCHGLFLFNALGVLNESRN